MMDLQSHRDTASVLVCHIQILNCMATCSYTILMHVYQCKPIVYINIYSLATLKAGFPLSHTLIVQVNHLGPLSMTLGLLSVLQEVANKDEDPRIVFVTSGQHFEVMWSSKTFNATEENYQRLETYKNTKLYNVNVLQWLFSVALCILETQCTNCCTLYYYCTHCS